MSASREVTTLVRVALPGLPGPPEPTEPLELLHATFVDHRFAPHSHDTFVLAVVEAGVGRSRYRGGTALYRPGSVVIIEPGELHTGEPATADGWRYRALYPSPALMARLAGAPALLEATAAGRRLFASSVVPDPALADRLLSAHRALAMPGADVLAGETRLTEVIGALVRQHACAAGVARAAGAHHPANGRAACGVRAARAHLHDAFAAPVSLATLAAVARLTPGQLARAFRAAVGLPPYTYLELVRVDQAKLRLRRGDAIADVAHATGFADQSHLTRRFRRVVGVTPGAYARACTTRHRSVA